MGEMLWQCVLNNGSNQPILVETMRLRMGLILLLGSMVSSAQGIPLDRVVVVEGGSLAQRQEKALAMEPEGRYWIAYQVGVKDNVAIDTHQVEVPWDASIHGPDISTNVSRDAATPDLGIFLRHDGAAVTDVQVFNL